MVAVVVVAVVVVVVVVVPAVDVTYTRCNGGDGVSEVSTKFVQKLSVTRQCVGGDYDYVQGRRGRTVDQRKRVVAMIGCIGGNVSLVVLALISGVERVQNTRHVCL